MRILFLDDDEERHEFFRRTIRFNHVDYVWTSIECIEALTNNDPYDLVCLDHDLGDKQYVKEVENTGTEVAEYISRQLPKEKYPKKIIIHSYNPVGAERMFQCLYNTGIDIIKKPFNV